MTFTSEGDEWHAAGHALGLTPFLTGAPLDERDSFRQVMARLGVPATRPRSVQHILAGVIDDVRVLLATYELSERTLTAAIAEVEPNLQLGLRAERAARHPTFFRGNDQELGVAELDSTLRIESLDFRQARSLLAPRSASDRVFAADLSTAARNGLFFNDSMLGYRLEGIADAGLLERCLRAAIDLRHDLVRRAHALQPTQYLVQLRHDWESFASSAGLAFDPATLRLHGVVAGIPIEIAQEGAPGRLQIAVRCRFRQPIQADVRLTKANQWPSHARPATSVYINDADFQNAFIVQGYPSERTKAVFEEPRFRAELLTAARAASHLELNHDGVTWFMPRPGPSVAELADHVEMAVRVARSREPPAGGSRTGPYR